VKNTFLSTQEYQNQKQYWMNQVTEFYNSTIHLLPPRLKKGEHETCQFHVENELAEKLTIMSKNNELLLYIILLSALKILVFKYTSSDDISIAAPVYGQTDQKYTLNHWIFFRVQLNAGMSVKELLNAVKKNVTKAYQNQHYPIENVFAFMNMDHVPVFSNLLLLMDNIHPIVETPLSLQDDQLLFRFNKDLDGLKLNIIFNSAALTNKSIQVINQHYMMILKQCTDNLLKEIKDIVCLTRQEIHQHLYEWNNSELALQFDTTIPVLFTSAVKKYSKNIAVVHGKEKILYSELNARANHLARHLKEKVAGSDNVNNNFVGILMETSIDLVIGVLAIVKAGFAFIPIDLQSPESRIKYILEDSKPILLLTRQNAISKLNLSTRSVCIDRREGFLTSPDDLKTTTSPNDLAYVIYTSGSTGSPLGVMIEHSSFLNSTLWRINNYRLTEKDKALLLVSPTFDGFYSILFSTLFSGGQIVLVDREKQFDAHAVNELIVQEKVTHMAMIPSLYQVILDVATKEQMRTLKFVVLAAEQAASFVCRTSQQMAPHVTLVNEYGPTENSVVSLCQFGMKPETPGIVGKPISNTQAYILDRNLNLLPAGICGEICVSGIGLARGYLNQVSLTSEKFVPHPFKQNMRLYKTGDLGKYLPDGSIEFLGRMDHQIKIRGYRTEPGEIEHCMMQFPGIKSVVVTAKKGLDDRNQLAAYFISAKNNLVVAELKSHVKRFFPSYMVPTYFMELQSFPLLTNGKVDYDSLPFPGAIMESVSEYHPPENEQEALLVEIWESLLAKSNISTIDNFFEIGGDSIKAIQMISRLRQRGFACNIQSLLIQPTIKQLVPLLKKISPRVSQNPVTGPVKLTPIQKWLLQKNDLSCVQHFNQSMMLFRSSGFQPQTIELVFKKLTEHHDALRMIYKKEKNLIQQWNRGVDNVAFSLKVIDLKKESLKETEQIIERKTAETHTSIELDTGPLVKLVLFQTKQGDHLLIVIHHLVIDVYSWQILLEDFSTAYQQVQLNKRIDLPLKTHSFQEWSDTLHRHAQGLALQKEIKYWQEVAESAKPIEYDHITTCKFKNMAATSFVLTVYETVLLKQATIKTYNTQLEIVLIAALALAYRQLKEKTVLLINVEGHGREDIFPDVFPGRTVGWFTAQFPLVVQIPTLDCRLTLELLKTAFAKLPNKGIGYGLLKYLGRDELNIFSQLEPSINFNYLGQFVLNQDESDALWKQSNLPSGKDIDMEWHCNFNLSIVCSIISDTLELTISYNPLSYKAEQIQRLKSHYKSFLLKIASEARFINHEEEKVSPRTFNRDFLYVNRNQQQKVFFFPPKMSLGLSYYLLAQYIKAADVYAFDVVEGTNIIDIYVKYIKSLCPGGPYVLGGYSSAALVFEVVKGLEIDGEMVSDLLLLDAIPNLSSSDTPVSEKGIEQSINFFLSVMKPYINPEDTNDHFTQSIRRKIMAHYLFIDKTVNHGPINTNIHFIQSEETREGDIQMWKALSCREVFVYNGHGDHDFMLNGTAAIQNAKLINQILSSIF